ncbi:serine decarboxylase [Trifolium repens]|nr:serine decarboxylase [Trifolium repens]
MENQVKENVKIYLNIPQVHSLEPCREEGKDRKIQEINNGHNMNLAITKCDGESQGKLALVINHYTETLNQEISHLLGYPTNQSFDYGALAPLMQFHINNLGDPFIGSSYGVNSAKFEVSVLDWFAKLWEIKKEEYWGYITSGGSEGNFHGLLIGRENFPDGIIYASQDSHYSIFKIAKMYRMQCMKVSTLITGEIDCANLKTLLLAHKDKPAIINLNIGTTMKGAVDNIDMVIQTLEETGFTRDRFYIHCDGALLGIMLPLIKQAPMISFKKPIGSITISGHKFLGCPTPCGVLLTRLEHTNTFSKDIEVIGSRDATISGSRSGHAPIFIWYALQKRGLIGLKNEVQKCLMNARYLKDKLCDVGISTMLNEFSNTVVFEKPLDCEFIRRWNLAYQGNIAHVVVMQHVTIEMLNSFVDEFSQKQKIWYGLRKPICIANEIGAENCACMLHK